MTRPAGEVGELGSDTAAASPNLGAKATSGAIWTLVSRVSGLLRVGVSAAVLGPTFFGNIFQSVNTVPNIVVSSLGWSVVSPLLVPAIVRLLDLGDRRRAERLAGTFLTLQLALLGVAVAFVMVASGTLAHLLTLGIADPGDAQAARRAALMLVLLVAPQILLYGVIGVAAAAQQARGRFALPAGAPVIENLGVIGALVAVAVLFGTGETLASRSGQAAIVLAIGSNLAVVAHAVVQVLGARRADFRVRPAFDVDDPELRALVRVGPASVLSTALVDMRYLVLAFACSTVAGGWIAFQIALQFSFLVPAMVGRPMGTALLAPLRRASDRGDSEVVATLYSQALALVRVVAIPAALALVLLSGPIAEVVSIGAMGTDRGINLVRISVLTLGLSVIAESLYEVSRHAAFAIGSPSLALRATFARMAVMCIGVTLAVAFTDGLLSLGLMGLTVTIADITSAWVIDRSVRWSIAADRIELADDADDADDYADDMLDEADAGALPLAVPVLGGGLALLAGWAVGNRVDLAIGSGWVSAFVGLAVAGLLAAALYGAVAWRAGVPYAYKNFGSTGRVTVDPLPSEVPVVPSTPPLRVLPREEWEASKASPIFEPPPLLVRSTRSRLFGPGHAAALFALSFVVAMSSAALAAIQPVLVAGGAIGGIVAGLVVWRPQLAVYMYLGVFPFLAGIDRGRLVPLLRPTEALQLFLTGAVIVGVGLRFVREGRPLRLRVGKFDRALLLLVVIGSSWPVIWLIVRGMTPTFADLLASVPIVRYYGLYVLVRSLMTLPGQLTVALRVWFGAAVAVAGIAVGQTAGVPGVRELLTAYWTSPDLFPLEALQGRASTTLGSPIATAMYLSLTVATAAAVLLNERRRPFVGLIALACSAGAIATGQMTAVLALLVSLTAVAALSGRVTWFLKRAVPVALVIAVLAWPVVERRIADFDGEAGLPQSWVVRIENIQLGFLPQFGGWRWAFGVKPDAVAVPYDRGRELIYIESGYLWMLFVGGIPFVLAYLGFVGVALGHLRRASRRVVSDAGAVTVAAFAAVVTVAVLNITDAHLTLRGGADVTFALLALAMSAGATARSPFRSTGDESDIADDVDIEDDDDDEVLSYEITAA